MIQQAMDDSLAAEQAADAKKRARNTAGTSLNLNADAEDDDDGADVVLKRPAPARSTGPNGAQATQVNTIVGPAVANARPAPAGAAAPSAAPAVSLETSAAQAASTLRPAPAHGAVRGASPAAPVDTGAAPAAAPAGAAPPYGAPSSEAQPVDAPGTAQAHGDSKASRAPALPAAVRPTPAHPKTNAFSSVPGAAIGAAQRGPATHESGEGTAAQVPAQRPPPAKPAARPPPAQGTGGIQLKEFDLDKG